MIQFKSLSWKNFLMTGNIPISYEFGGGTTLFVGKSGVGKSTILDALTFAWFGKTYRDINKPTIVNSINAKECVVESVVERNGHTYRMVRGLKPTLLELWDNGVAVKLPAGAIDSQKLIEEQYLRLDYKTFRHIVLLGAATYTPFMRLTAAQRRMFVEDVLDIRIFSTMAVLGKERLAATMAHQSSLQRQQQTLTDRLAIILKYEAQHVEAESTRIRELQNRIDAEQQVRSDHVRSLQTLVAERDHLKQQVPDLQAQSQRYHEASDTRTSYENNVQLIDKRVGFYTSTAQCSQCKQSLDAAFVERALAEFRDKKSKLTTKIEEVDRILTDTVGAIAALMKVQTSIQRAEIQVARVESAIHTCDRQIRQWTHEQQQKRSVPDVVDRPLVERELEQIDQALSDAATERHQYELVTSLLKDDGIKTSVIRQYLPIINRHVNHFLRELDLPVQFEFDETFAEHFKSLYRNEFTYENFSEGQKRRIDIAIMLAWRAVAKAKNNSSTNLLILDEVFDGSLDGDAIENLIGIIRKMETEVHVLVISHREAFFDKFARVFEVKNVKNFTAMNQRI